MCRRTTCTTCHRPTYAGCGMHVEQVLGDVPLKERCQCGEARTPEPLWAGVGRLWARLTAKVG